MIVKDVLVLTDAENDLDNVFRMEFTTAQLA